MPINKFHVQLATAYPGVRAVDSGKGNTLRGRIATDGGAKTAYIKLLGIEDIAREAICAVLARKLHLPMLQPYYVQVDPTILSGVRGVGPKNPSNLAFGLEEELVPYRRVVNQLLDEELQLWPDALRVAAFDEWVFNRDRIPSNLLFAGDHQFWLIDHDDALPNYASPECSSSSQLLQLLRKNKPQLALFRMHRSLRKRIEEYRSIDWNEILHLLNPHELTGSVSIYGRYIGFLRQRIGHLDSIFSQDLGIRQQELGFDASTDRSTKKEL